MAEKVRHLASASRHADTEDIIECARKNECPHCHAEISRRLQQAGGSGASVFAAVAQPEYIWKELPVPMPFGVTELPKPSNKHAKKNSFPSARITYAGGDDPLSNLVRLHELMHARFTPEVLDAATPKSASTIAKQIAEDVRLAAIGKERGLFTEDVYFPRQAWEVATKGKATASNQELATAALYMASYGVPIEGGQDIRDVDVFCAASQCIMAPATKATVANWQRDVESILASSHDAKTKFVGLTSAVDRALRIVGGAFYKDALACVFHSKPSPLGAGLLLRQVDLDDVEKILLSERAALETTSAFGYSRSSAEVAKNYSLDPTPNLRWGTMTLQAPPLLRNFRALVRRRGVAAPEGPLPQRMDRWLSDRHVFDRKGRRRGGTLLVDVSGSMNWTRERTAKILEATPAMTIAIYSSNATLLGGFCTIIARSGRMVDEDFNHEKWGHAGGNVIDGPALSWLAKMPAPRVWFCDGGVTGICDDLAPGLIEDAERLRSLGNITRTTKIDILGQIFAMLPTEQRIGGKA